MDPARAWLICPVTVIRVKISERGTEFASIRVTPDFFTMWFDRFFVVVVESGKFSSAMIGFRMLGENAFYEKYSMEIIIQNYIDFIFTILVVSVSLVDNFYTMG